MATNARPKAHVKNVRKKTVEMESEINLKDFEMWKLKFSDYLASKGLNDTNFKVNITRRNLHRFINQR